MGKRNRHSAWLEKWVADECVDSGLDQRLEHV